MDPLWTDIQLIRDARFDCYSISEMSYAHDLVTSVPDSAFTVFDRRFLSAQRLSSRKRKASAVLSQTLIC
ncbi:hypothetical protein CSZ94_22425 [Janthinobacterium sp. ROICE36]|nr:hypothetical protein CSZ94_22425 [Janthinobacterium sp. ROICE36]